MRKKTLYCTGCEIRACCNHVHRNTQEDCARWKKFKENAIIETEAMLDLESIPSDYLDLMGEDALDSK